MTATLVTDRLLMDASLVDAPLVDAPVIDGTHLPWQDFADLLIALCDTAGGYACAGYVRAPTGCGAEARRLIRHLDLADRIAVLDEAPARRWRCSRRARGLVAALALLGSAFAPRRPSGD